MGTELRGRRVSVAAGVVLGLALLAGCGSDDEDGGGESPATLEITATEDGTKTTLDAPESAEAGVTEITMTNEGERPHSGQLIRVEGDHSEEEVLAGLQAASSGKPFPEWFFGGGGTGTAGPGESRTVTQELEPDSTYWVVDDEAPGKPPVAPIEITGEGSGETLEETANEVSAVDFGFESDGLTAGEPITFKNEGEQPHHMVAMPIVDDEASIEDVATFMETEGKGGGKPPVDFEGGSSTSVLEGGTEQVSGVSLDPGRYALVCFISNREGGPPHVTLGMVDEVEVSE
jgi:hypothetical protein